jgi:hypothetical protein
MRVRDLRKNKHYARSHARRQSWNQVSLMPAIAVGVVIACVCLVAYFMF